jgi:hypothetical protein
MRTHNYAFLLALIAVSAEGADFRALDIGQSCATVVEWEIAHGSTPVPWTTVPGAETYAFRVRQFDRDILAQYVCVKGNLLAGNYLFPLSRWTKLSIATAKSIAGYWLFTEFHLRTIHPGVTMSILV